MKIGIRRENGGQPPSKCTFCSIALKDQPIPPGQEEPIYIKVEPSFGHYGILCLKCWKEWRAAINGKRYVYSALTGRRIK